MPLPVSLYIGLRHLRPKKKSFFISLTSVISIVGIALGVATLIVVVGVMTGFEKELRTKILGTQSHIVVVEAGSAAMNKWRDVLERVRK